MPHDDLLAFRRVPGPGPRYARPPLRAIRRVFPHARFVSLRRRLQTDPTDSFCAVWGAWYLSGQFRPRATLDDLLRWWSGLFRRPPLLDDFRSYLRVNHEQSAARVQRTVRMLQGLTADAYRVEYHATPHVDPDEFWPPVGPTADGCRPPREYRRESRIGRPASPLDQPGR